MRTMTIADAARQSGLSAHTLRYYERIGLIHPVERLANGRRDYTEADIRWLEFLIKLRATGMPIADMCHYAELVRGGDATIAARRDLLAAHRRRVLNQITQLTADLEIVNSKISMYSEKVSG